MLRRRSEDVHNHSGPVSSEGYGPFHDDDRTTGTSEDEKLIGQSRTNNHSSWDGYTNSGLVFFLHSFRLASRRPIQIAAAFFVVILLALALKGPHTSRILPHRWRPYDEFPFSGAFARFPRTSALSPRQQRITIVGAWNGNTFPSFMRHFFYTIQQNADVVDLLMVNRLLKDNDRCMDFDKAGVDITWGGNVKVVCVDDKEWKKRHVDFMCGQEYGWNCNATEYQVVTKEYASRLDAKNFNWRPFRGYAFRDLFLNPDNPFWGWIDHDLILGDFRRYPFNILSQLSFLTGSHVAAEHLFMAGQLTAFNFDDVALGSAWKSFPQLRTPSHFTDYINGKMLDSAEESYWSYGYFRDEKGLPGKNLSWGVYPDLHGDDYYNGQYSLDDSPQIYVVSGRDVLLVPTNWTKEDIEDVIRRERQTPVDDLGNIGWTTGEDESEHLLDGSDLNGEEARNLALDEKQHVSSQSIIRNGFAEMVPIKHGCRDTVSLGYGGYRQCVRLDKNSKSLTPVYRPLLIRFPELPPMTALRRMEFDDRPRNYERKLIRHLHATKHRIYLDLPNFEITDNLVMRQNLDLVEVWKMGPTRNETLFYRDRVKVNNIG